MGTFQTVNYRWKSLAQGSAGQVKPQVIRGIRNLADVFNGQLVRTESVSDQATYPVHGPMVMAYYLSSMAAISEDGSEMAAIIIEYQDHNELSRLDGAQLSQSTDGGQILNCTPHWHVRLLFLVSNLLIGIDDSTIW